MFYMKHLPKKKKDCLLNLSLLVKLLNIGFAEEYKSNFSSDW